MYSVLVPFDADEERAVAQGEMILRLPDVADSVEVTLLHVVEESGGLSIGGVESGGDVVTGTGTTAEVEAQAGPGDILEIPAGERLHGMLDDAGVTVRTERRTGDPAEGILAVAKEIAADQIVLGGRKRSPLGTLLFGSVTQAVILDAHRPVTVAGADIKEEPSHRCQNCGESYYSNPERDIAQCRRCGGTHVERVQ